MPVLQLSVGPHKKIRGGARVGRRGQRLAWLQGDKGCAAAVFANGDAKVIGGAVENAGPEIEAHAEYPDHHRHTVDADRWTRCSLAATEQRELHVVGSIGGA